ncbi:MAG: folate-binding protein [Pseudomonadota bacterium]
MSGEHAENRTVFALTGEDRVEFLQNIVTNDVVGLQHGLVYAALLSPQGKYLADFFLVPDGERILIDVDSDLAASLFKRLSMYKLRAAVTLEQVAIPVARGLGEAPEGGYADPRDTSLGWRAYGLEAGPPSIDWDAIRVAQCIPQSQIELIPDQTFILEAGFEQFAGVDFRKGCYVGQEVTARMKHKTTLRKGYRQVRLDGEVPVGSEILSAGKPAGTVFTQANGAGIAYLRFDRISDDMTANDVKVVVAD